MPSEPCLTIKDYLDATSEASKRTRIVMISIVVASVLAFAGFLNSIEQSWMLQRVRAMLASPDPTYFNEKFPGINSDIKAQAYRRFLSALMTSYVNNTYTIHVPFFGITFDVNDLGMLGGFSFIVLLLLFRFSLMRELDNLVLSFAEAKKRKELPSFYHLLAMRQVLSVPPTDNSQEGHWIKSIPKGLSLLPFLVLSVVMGNDFITNYYGNAISSTHTVISYIVTGILWAFVLVTSIECLKVWKSIDRVWTKYWGETNAANIRVIPRTEENPSGVSSGTESAN